MLLRPAKAKATKQPILAKYPPKTETLSFVRYLYQSKPRERVFGQARLNQAADGLAVWLEVPAADEAVEYLKLRSRQIGSSGFTSGGFRKAPVKGLPIVMGETTLVFELPPIYASQ